MTVPVPDHRELRTGTLMSIIRPSELDRTAFEVKTVTSARPGYKSRAPPVERTRMGAATARNRGARLEKNLSVAAASTRPAAKAAAPAVGPMTAGLVGSERVRHHPHRRARSAPQCGVY